MISQNGHSGHTIEALKRISQNVPRELIEDDRWVLWKCVERNGKSTKPPFNARTGELASSTDRSTWVTIAEAGRVFAAGGWQGLGRAFAPEDRYVGIDLDHCRNPHTGALEPWAQAIVDRFASYAEVSPSGTGVHIIVRASLPGPGRKTPYGTGSVEAYDRARYFTVTGQILPGAPLTVADRQHEMDEFYAEVFPPTPQRRRAELQAVEDDPPVRLDGRALERWRGELTERTPAGKLDRSASLFIIGLDLAEAGATYGTIVAALRDRDGALGWHKFDGRDDSDERYGEIAAKALAGGEPDTGGESGAIDLSDLATEVVESGPVPESPRSHQNPSNWPDAIAAEAYYGVVGDIVRAIEPHSEADSAALFAHVLPTLGALIGPEVRALAGDAVHPSRLDAAVVGETSKGRKGSAWRPIERVVKAVSVYMLQDFNLASGLSSGEGLIWQVRDPIFRRERVKQPDGTWDIEEVEVDPGVSDKRLLVVEAEFASVLRVIQREGNTLSTLVRLAWDSGDLQQLVKNSPAKATGAHIGIIGHVTKDELLRYLDRSELASGFANRFLWFACRRGRVLSRGAITPDDALEPLVERLAEVIVWAKEPRILDWDEESGQLWDGIYPLLSEGKRGLFGGAVNRAEAQVLRLAVLYAVLDMSEAIRVPHLLAALAVWNYCEQSARWIFGDATGDPLADAILTALRQAGEMDRTGLSKLFANNMPGGRIERALNSLKALGLVAATKDKGTGGRPREVWRAT